MEEFTFYGLVYGRQKQHQLIRMVDSFISRNYLLFSSLVHAVGSEGSFFLSHFSDFLQMIVAFPIDIIEDLFTIRFILMSAENL